MYRKYFGFCNDLTIDRLHLVINDIQDVIDFLTNATFAFLHNLIIESPKSSRPPLREKAIALFNAMTEACSAETLNTITITGDVRRPYNSNIPIGDAREEYIIQPSALTPLFKFTNVRQLWLQDIWCWDLDDTFVLQACRAWPKLSAFVLGPSHHWPESNLRITIGVLESFVHLLPDLEIFGATLDTNSPPPQATTNSPWYHTRQIEHIVAIQFCAWQIRRRSRRLLERWCPVVQWWLSGYGRYATVSNAGFDTHYY
ncbi:hypothetical protein QCA50_015028 [Cerrena zonata]|uniref:Heterokaryon incompatibility domain-containing protein n=1 Tax=Cerrena zonata TaxID=2478898 RepID=A0AAW0FR68_9APHY